MVDESAPPSDPRASSRLQQRADARVVPLQPLLDQTTPTLPWGGGRLETGHRDDQGRMVVYYSLGDAQLTPIQRAQAQWDLAANDARPQAGTDRFQSSLTPDPAVTDAFLGATKAYEEALPVVFRPLSEAPVGTAPDIIVVPTQVTSLDPNRPASIQGKAGFPGEAPYFWLNSAANPREMQDTAVHELGHRFGLKHPQHAMEGNAQTRIHSDTQRVSDMATDFQGAHAVWSDGSPQHIPLLSDDARLNVADRQVLQQIYGAAAPAEPAATPAPSQASVDILQEADGRVLDASRAVAPAQGGLQQRTMVNANGVVALGANGTELQVANADQIQTWRGTAQADEITSSTARGNVLQGQGGHDRYNIVAAANGDTHRIEDQGVNTVTVAAGANVAVQYPAGSEGNETILHYDSAIRDVTAQRTADQQVTVTINSRYGGAPTTITLPANDRQVQENRLSVMDDRSEYFVPIDTPGAAQSTTREQGR